MAEFAIYAQGGPDLVHGLDDLVGRNPVEHFDALIKLLGRLSFHARGRSLSVCQ